MSKKVTFFLGLFVHGQYLLILEADPVKVSSDTAAEELGLHASGCWLLSNITSVRLP